MNRVVHPVGERDGIAHSENVVDFCPHKPEPRVGLFVLERNALMVSLHLPDMLTTGEFVISIHKGCKITIDASEPGLITHMCDTLGQSGAPILLLSQGSAKVIGIHSSRVQDFEPNVGWKTLKSVGVSAREFGQSTLLTTP